jgi:hypothetical protein
MLACSTACIKILKSSASAQTEQTFNVVYADIHNREEALVAPSGLLSKQC